jgi:zinc protease
VPGIAEFRETCVLDVLQILFGGTAHGLIAGALADAGVPFSKIRTDYITRREPTIFSVTVAVEPSDADRVTPAVAKIFRRMASSGVTDGELSYARRLIEGSELYEQETFAGQARSLGYYETIQSYGLSLKYIDTVRALTPGDVSALARKYFTTDDYAVVILEPEVAK